MRTLVLAAAAAAALTAAPAFAQDDTGQYPAADQTTSSTATVDDAGTSHIEPYLGIMGGYENFDNERNSAGIPVHAGSNYQGGLVQGVVGVNVPIGPLFVGAEGNVIKGFTGDVDWEYGAAGRFGVRAGDGLIYGKVGYQWVNFDALGDNSPDFHDMTYGAGVELSPSDLGMGNANKHGLRLRMEVDTFGSTHSFRPMAGMIAHF
ncbi:MAG: opacity protein [Sphingomonas sp.]